MESTENSAWGPAAGLQSYVAPLDLRAVPHSAGAGSRFTAAMRRSWGTQRTVNPGLLALSILADDVRRRLFEACLDSGAASAYLAAEADSLLDHIAAQLPNASLESAVCRLEQLTLRASDHACSFVAPDPTLLRPQRIVRRAPHAGIVLFHGKPDPVLTALLQATAPSGAAPGTTAVLVAPGLKPLCRTASPPEQSLWMRLELPAAAATLARDGAPRAVIESMLQAGALEYA